MAPSYSCKIGITQYRAYSFCLFLQIPVSPHPVILCSQRSPGCHFPLMSHNPLPIRQTLPGSHCLTAFGFHWSHSTAKLKPLINTACKFSEYSDLLKISQNIFRISEYIFFRVHLLLIHWTAGLGWQTGPQVWPLLCSFYTMKRNLLQLQFHHTGTAFWTWSRHSTRCHYRGPRGTVHIWGQEDIISSINLGDISIKSSHSVQELAFFCLSLLLPPFTPDPQVPPSHSLYDLLEAARTDLGVCCVLFNQCHLLLCPIKNVVLPSLQSALPMVIKWKTKLP